MDSSNPPPPPSPSFPPPLFSPSHTPPRFAPPKPLAGSTKPRARRKPDFSGQPKATPPCTECGKRFSSWKALFGHMRCHPEREWRGINPPPHSQRTHFTDEEYQVAATLVLLANGPPAVTPSGEVGGGAVIIRSLSSSFERRRKRKRFETHFSPTPSPSYYCPKDEILLDLNMPPPLENGEGGVSPVLDLKLGI